MHNRWDNRSINGSSYCARGFQCRAETGRSTSSRHRSNSIPECCQLSVVRCMLRPYPIAERRRAPSRRPGWAGLGTAHNGPRTTDHGPRTTDHGPRTTDHGPRTTDYYGVVDWLLIFLTRVSARLTRRGWIPLWRMT